MLAALATADPLAVADGVREMRWGSIAAISALIIASKGAEVSGLLSRAAARLASSTDRPALALTYLAAATAPFVMNDTAILVFAPMAAAVSRLCGYPLAAVTAYVAIAANVGSALTPFGNPQNLIIWTHYGVPIQEFVAVMAPFTAAGLALLAVPVARLPKARVGRMPPVRLDARLAAASLVAVAGAIALTELGHPVEALALSAVLVAVARPRALLAVDYVVIAVLALMLLDFRVLATLIAPYIPVLGGGAGSGGPQPGREQCACHCPPPRFGGGVGSAGDRHEPRGCLARYGISRQHPSSEVDRCRGRRPPQASPPLRRCVHCRCLG